MNFLDYDSYGTCFRRYSSFLSSAHFELGGDGGPSKIVQSRSHKMNAGDQAEGAYEGGRQLSTPPRL